MIKKIIARLVTCWIANKIETEPDMVIGDNYLRRWFITPRHRWLRIYFHEFRSSDDRILHDHPWNSISLILKGNYWEHFENGTCRLRRPGQMVFRKRTTLHRVEMYNEYRPVYTLFVFWGKQHDWGFQFPDGWVSHKDCLDMTDPYKSIFKPEYAEIAKN